MIFPRIGLSVLLALAFTAAPCAMAQNEVYVCINENGTKEYRNTNISRNCKRMDLPAGTNIPAPASAPRRAVNQASTAPAAPAGASAAGDIARVDSGTQRARDNDRRQILADEMAREQKKLADLKLEYANGEPERRGDERNYAKYQERVALMKNDIARTEKNIEALKREIGNLR